MAPEDVLSSVSKESTSPTYGLSTDTYSPAVFFIRIFPGSDAYLIPRYPLAKLVLILFVIKECYMTVAGWKVLMETKETIEAQWHGKLNTAVTYVVVLILLAGPRLPYSTSNVLIGACAVCMAMSLSMYAAQFREMLEHQNGRYQRKMQGGFSGN